MGIGLTDPCHVSPDFILHVHQAKSLSFESNLMYLFKKGICAQVNGLYLNNALLFLFPKGEIHLHDPRCVGDIAKHFHTGFILKSQY